MEPTALEKLRESVKFENIRCCWAKCTASAKDTKVYFYLGGREVYCAKHLSKVDPGYKRMLDRAEQEARQYAEQKRYGDVEFGSHRDARRPQMVCA